jgi:hypothetical protein
MQDLTIQGAEDKQMFATSINNNNSQLGHNEYIIKRRLTNKKDHFVFSMECRAAS